MAPPWHTLDCQSAAYDRSVPRAVPLVALRPGMRGPSSTPPGGETRGQRLETTPRICAPKPLGGRLGSAGPGEGPRLR